MDAFELAEEYRQNAGRLERNAVAALRADLAAAKASMATLEADLAAAKASSATLGANLDAERKRADEAESELEAYKESSSLKFNALQCVFEETKNELSELRFKMRDEPEECMHSFVRQQDAAEGRESAGPSSVWGTTDDECPEIDAEIDVRTTRPATEEQDDAATTTTASQLIQNGPQISLRRLSMRTGLSFEQPQTEQTPDPTSTYEQELADASVFNHPRCTSSDEPAGQNSITLASREAALLTFDPIAREVVRLPDNRHGQVAFALTSNVLVQTLTDETNALPRKLITTWLGLRDPQAQHFELDLEQPIIDFVFQGNRLAVITPLTPSPDKKDNFEVGFWTVRSATGKLVKQSTIKFHIHIPPSNNATTPDVTSKFKFSSVFGENSLAVTFALGGHAPFHLLLFDLNAGSAIEVDPIPLGGLGAAPLDSERFLVLGPQQRLHVIHIQSGPGPVLTRTVFGLPELATGYHIDGLTVLFSSYDDSRDATETSYSAARYVPRRFDDLILVVFKMCQVATDEQKGQAPVPVTLVIRRARLLELADGNTHDWEQWGTDSARWFNSANGMSGFSVVGQRVVMLTKDVSNLKETSKKTKSSICIANFDPTAVECQRTRLVALREQGRTRSKRDYEDTKHARIEVVDGVIDTAEPLPLGVPRSSLAYVATTYTDKNVEFDDVVMHGDAVVGIHWWKRQDRESPPDKMEIFRFGILVDLFDSGSL